ncbi:DUF6446 family protein [Amaricoccus macauensis]|uniref:DUF6446 family protein n=1 Tax=Amaricoccus macauensis TaxID=57001 RepID=UPI003C7C4C77
MSGRKFILGFLVLLVIFTAGLIYTQFYAYYERDRESEVLRFGELVLPVQELDLIDASTSPLKLRACFRADPVVFEDLPEALQPTPLTPPPWFSCFDAESLAEDLSAGRAVAHFLAQGEPDGTDTVVASYPDGRAYLWRQLDARYSD